MARPRPQPGLLLVVQRELRWIRHRPVITFLALVFPLLVCGLLAGIFNSGLPTDLPVAVVDKDRSDLSRQVIRMVDATPDVAVAYAVEDLAAGRRLILEGTAYAVVMLPANLERDVKAGRRPDVAVFYNNQFMTIGSIVSRAIGSAVATAATGVGVAARTSRGQGADAALASLIPIPVQQSPLFNPTLNYVFFLLAAQIPTVMQIFICVVSAYSIGLDRRGVIGLRLLSKLGGGIGPAIVGKMLPYTFAFMATLGIADSILFGWLGAPFRGHWPLLLAANLLFVLAYQLVGALFALVGRDLVQSLNIAGLFTAPAFGFVGISFPRLAMGWFAQAWGAILPLTWYMQIRIDQTLRGAPVEASLRPLAYLALCVAVAALLVVLRVAKLRRDRLRAGQLVLEAAT
ncbi:ABC transporter permease [Oleomonas cavernae]|uniref:ABC transporter permease n=1 Tax=Oleomonas cavernae TaxID=2320859 RepID=A0A418WGK1_9PROT|nr:ABC transporter permease [Oleomonas cavernae]RJF89156.1 ABC transporter permease [Oleomonas cavernae]